VWVGAAQGHGAGVDCAPGKDQAWQYLKWRLVFGGGESALPRSKLSMNLAKGGCKRMPMVVEAVTFHTYYCPACKKERVAHSVDEYVHLVGRDKCPACDDELRHEVLQRWPRKLW